MKDILITESKEQFNQVVCTIIKEQAVKNIKERGSFTFVLSGGKTPKDIFVELASNYRDSIEWSKVHFFWLDERCIEPSSIDSNYKLAYDNLISKLDKVGSVHYIRGDLEQPEAIRLYKEELLSFFGSSEVQFDFILLGMGEDGHVASLFPNSKELKSHDELVLGTEKKFYGYKRITLGLDLINKTKFNLLLISSLAKMKIIRKNLSLPINLIKIDKKIGVL